MVNLEVAHELTNEMWETEGENQRGDCLEIHIIGLLLEIMSLNGPLHMLNSYQGVIGGESRRIEKKCSSFE